MIRTLALLPLVAVMSLLPNRHRLFILALLSTPLVLTPIVPYSLWFSCVAACAPALLLRPRPLYRHALVSLVTAILALGLFYSAWSYDASPAMWVISNLACFVLVLTMALEAAEEDPGVISLVLAGYAIPLTLEALLTLACRVSPDLERTFWFSRAGSLTIGPKTVEGLFGASPNNVLDIDKAGGVFVNGNVASMFMGASAMALLGVWAYQKKRWALAVAIVAFMGTVATGSKTGLGLTILLPLGSVAVYHALRLKVGMVPVAFAIGLLGCAFEYLRGSSVSTGSLVSSSVSTIEVRNKIWYAAWELFLRHPIAGLGLGGWEQQMPYWRSRLGLPLDYPPHNYIIYSWAQLGLLGAVLVVAFVVTVGVVAQRAVSMSSNDPAALAGAIFFSGAMVWVLLHGMGDNTTIYGDQRSMVLVGAVLAQLALPWQRCHGRTEQGVPSAERAMEPLPAAGVNNGV